MCQKSRNKALFGVLSYHVPGRTEFSPLWCFHSPVSLAQRKVATRLQASSSGCALCAGLEAGFSCSKELLGPVRQKGRTEAGQGTTPPRMGSHQTCSLSEQDKLLPNI